MALWVVKRGVKVIGKFTTQDLKDQCLKGEIRSSDLIKQQGQLEWRAVSSIKGLLPAVSADVKKKQGSMPPGVVRKLSVSDSEQVAHDLLDQIGKKPGVYFIGRGDNCDLTLDYPMVSLRHAKLTVDPQTGINIRDLGSSNGTFINGQRITRRMRVQPSDSVVIGSVWFVLSKDGLSLELGNQKSEIVLEGRGIGVKVAGGKHILDDVSLAVLPGELVGLMGPSGAGKSTLISALNGYCPPASGNVTINGRDLYEQYDEFRGMIGYVPQDDIMHADLTVQEALYYSARLRLPKDYSDNEISQRIRKVIKDLGLEGTEHTRIGNAELRGISGGQRKRVNVAMELLTDPPLLFLDEPTSGTIE